MTLQTEFLLIVLAFTLIGIFIGYHICLAIICKKENEQMKISESKIKWQDLNTLLDTIKKRREERMK